MSPGKRFVLLTVCLLLFSLFSTAVYASGTASEEKKKTLTIGIVYDGPWKSSADVFDLFKKEIRVLLENEYQVRFPKEKEIMGNWTTAGIRAGLDRLLNDKEVDIIIAGGLVASDEVCHRKDLAKPVIAPFIVDPKIQGLPRKGKGSGVKNLNYLVPLHEIFEGIKEFRRFTHFDHMTFMVADHIRENFPPIERRVNEMAAVMGMKYSFIWVKEPVDDVIKQIKPEMQAVFITPMINIKPSDFSRIIEALNRHKIPSFSHLGKAEVELGVLATIHRESDNIRFARRVALNIQRILMGEQASELPVEFKLTRGMTINMKTARQIGVYPTWDMMTEATLLYEEEAKSRPVLKLMDAVDQAIRNNIELYSKQLELRNSKQNIRAAYAKLMPQVDVSALYLKIDKDRAAASMGTAAENTFSGSVNLTQVIYSEPAIANLSINRKISRSIKAELDGVTLDTALSAATAYLDVLRAKALERVQKDNLGKTRNNLELARMRKSIGVSGPSEVYRWEAQYATARKELMDANTQRELAEINLNRILHVPQSHRFMITDTGLDAPFLNTGGGRFYDFVDNPWIYKIFLEFIVQDSLKRSPELCRLDNLIAAQERYYKSTRRQMFRPTLALTAGLTNRFSRTGEGSGSRDMSGLGLAFNPAQMQALGSLFPSPSNDLDWNVGLSLSFPLFSGGGKFVEKKKAHYEVEKLKVDRQVLKERLEQQIRSSVRLVGTAHAKIQPSSEAAEAARKTLELVTDAYSRGAVSIIELIDAQNAALAAERSAANAIYDFMIQLFKGQRACNRLDFLITPEVQDTVLVEFEAYLKKQGITIKKRGRK